jgi:hypothetical protein
MDSGSATESANDKVKVDQLRVGVVSDEMFEILYPVVYL